MNSAHCRHVNRVDHECVKAALENPESWACQACGTTDTIAVCLSCGLSSCVPHAPDVCPAHHALRLSLNKDGDALGEVSCRLCLSVCHEDNRKGEIGLLRTLLGQVQHVDPFFGAADTTATRSGTAFSAGRAWRVAKRMLYLQYLNPKAKAERQKRDKMKAALVRWRCGLLSRSFNSWRHFVRRGKELHEELLDRAELSEEEEAHRMEAATTTPTITATKMKKEKKKTTTKKKMEAPPSDAAAPALKKARVLGKFAPGHCGLRNLGNSCYFNSVLQALSNVGPELREHLMDLSAADGEESGDAQEEATSICWSKDLGRLYKVVWSGKRVVHSPDDVLADLWSLNELFKGFLQQDAQEFLLFTLDRLSEEQRAFPPPDYNIIAKHFEGKLCDKVVCAACGYTAQRRVPTGVVSIQIPPMEYELSPSLLSSSSSSASSSSSTSRRASSSRRAQGRARSLLECLTFTFSEEERLVGDNSYFCEECERRQEAAKKLSIHSLPSKFLIIHVVRTGFDKKSLRVFKNQTLVDFPLRGLDLTSLVGDQESKKHEFDLAAVVTHHGRGMSEGHYTCFARNEEHQSWLLFNDARVTAVSEAEVQNSQAYLLFYTRRETE